MLTLTCLLAVASFVGAILSLMGKVPVTVPVFLLACLALLSCLPVR